MSSPTWRGCRGCSTSPTRTRSRTTWRICPRRWPASVPYDALSRLVPDRGLDSILLSLFRSGVVELHAAPAHCCATISDRPAVSRLARWQMRRGRIVTSQRHRPVELDDDAARFLLPLLDGSLRMDYRGKPLREQVNLAEILPEFVRFHLEKMANLALLIG